MTALSPLLSFFLLVVSGTDRSESILGPSGTVRLLEEVAMVDDTPDFEGAQLIVMERVGAADLLLAFPEPENLESWGGAHDYPHAEHSAHLVSWHLASEDLYDLRQYWNASTYKADERFYVQPSAWASGSAQPSGIGILAPGESLEALDGIVIHVQSPEYTEPMQVYVQHVPYEDLPVPFPSYESPVTPFYRISSDTSWNALSMTGLDVFVLVPAAPEGYRVVAHLLIDTSNLYHPIKDVPGIWAKTWIGVDTETGSAHIRVRRLDPEGLYFTFTFAKL